MELFLKRLLNSLPDSWKAVFRRGLQFLAERPPLRSVFWIAVGLVAVGLFGSWHYDNLAWWLLTFPLFLYVFLERAGAEARHIYTPPSVRCAIIGALGFFLTLHSSGYEQLVAYMVGISAILFVFIDAPSFCRLVAARRVPAAVAVVGVLSGFANLVLQTSRVKEVTLTTLNTLYLLLHRYIPDLEVFESGHRSIPGMPNLTEEPATLFHHGMHRRGNFTPPRAPLEFHHEPFQYMAIASEHFKLALYAFENIAMGLFVFTVLVALELMLSGWQRSAKRLATIVVGGMLFLFTVNVLVLAVYFVLGDIAHTPDASVCVVFLFNIMSFVVTEPIIGLAGYVLVSLLFIRRFFKAPAILKYFHLSVA